MSKEKTKTIAKLVGVAPLGDPNIKGMAKKQKGITLIALIITILFSYDEMIKFSNSKGFLPATI